MTLTKWFVPYGYFQSEGNTTANLQLCKHEHARRVTTSNSSYNLPSSPSSMTLSLQLVALISWQEFKLKYETRRLSPAAGLRACLSLPKGNRQHANRHGNLTAL